MNHAEHSGDLWRFIKEGKKIIISTVQKFPATERLLEIEEKFGEMDRGERQGLDNHFMSPRGVPYAYFATVFTSAGFTPAELPKSAIQTNGGFATLS